MIQILMMRWSSLNQFSFQSMSWMHYGLVLVSLTIRRSKIFHDIDIFYQLFSKNVILCVNSWSKPALPPTLSSHSLLATLFHPSCDLNMMHFFCFGQHLPRYVSNTLTSAIFLLFLVQFMQPFVLFRVLINWIFYLRRMSCPSFCIFFFLVPF